MGHKIIQQNNFDNDKDTDMNKTFKLAAMAVAASLLLSSCTKQAPAGNGEDGLVTFSLGVEGVAVAEQENGTKAGQISSIDKFKVTAWNNDTSDKTAFISGYQEYSYSGSTVSTDKRWTKPYNKIFYAYANLPGSGATVASADYTGQTLTYTVPATAAAQNDILMGTYSGDGTSTRTAALKFKHALTSVVFKVGTLTNVQKITKITIKGVYASGSVTQGSNGAFGTWTASATQDVTQTLTADLPTTAGAAIGVPFILIPQTAADGLEVEMELTLTDNTTMTCTGTLGKTTGGIAWTAGATNNYTISVSNLNTLKFGYSITGWGSNGDAIPVDVDE